MEEEKLPQNEVKTADNDQTDQTTQEVKNVDIKKVNKGNSDLVLTKKQKFLQFLKFLCFSISAGVIQIGSFELMYDVIGWKAWWATYLISLVLSIIWNFTFNRKFTFKSASNVPVAMILVLVYYCAFTPLSVFGGRALEGIGWNGTLVTAIMMVINFVTEFIWDKFVVFNDKLMNKILKKKNN